MSIATIGTRLDEINAMVSQMTTPAAAPAATRSSSTRSR